MDRIALEMAVDLIAGLATIGALWLGLFVFRRQTNAQLFLTLTQRYDDIMRSFPDQSFRLRFHDDPPPPSPALTIALLRYLNLCSEEFYLCRGGYLEKGLWRVWEVEMLRTVHSPLMEREWPQLRPEFAAYAEFLQFVEERRTPRREP